MVAHAPIPDLVSTKPSGKAKGKAGTKKATTAKKPKKVPPTPQGKYKSAEIIEDSDAEYGLGNDASIAAEEDDDDDEFAKMVGESLAGGTGADEDGDDDDDEEEEEDDEDDLGGARLAVRQETGHGQFEWL
jgi:hypothetical protein